MNTKLIIITGMSGAGKSTTSKSLARQLRKNGISARWLHEEIRKHPIRDGEFTAAPLETEADFAVNIQDMFRRWDRLVKRILRAKSVYVMEGMLTENILRYFFAGNYPTEKILAYYGELWQRLAPLNPVIIHLVRADVQGTLEAMYKQRGDWWKKLILRSEWCQRYLLEHNLSGDAGVYKMWENYQALAEEAVRTSPGLTASIDTSAGDWERYTEQMLSMLGLRYFPPDFLPVRHPEQFCGAYAVQVGDETHKLGIGFDGTYLYAHCGWPYMRLHALGGSKFEFASFPIKLTFRKGGADRAQAMDVSGIYDWEIVGTTMQRVAEP